MVICYRSLGHGGQLLTKLNNPFGHTNTGNLITCESEIAFTAHLYSRFDREH